MKDFSDQKIYNVNEYLELIQDRHQLMNFELVDQLEDAPIIASYFDKTKIDIHFFESHKEEFVKASQEYIRKQIERKELYQIPNFAITNDFLNEIKEIPYFQDRFLLTINEVDKNYHLSEETKNTLKNLNQDIVLEENGDSFYISVKEEEKILISSEGIDKHNKACIAKFPNTEIEIIMNAFHKTTKEKAELALKEIETLKEIYKINPNAIVTIPIYGRSIAKETGLLEEIINFNNIKIKNELDTYTLKEYLEDEKILSTLTDPIKNSKMSPYEKYLAAYNLVKQFKPYNENHQKKEESRNLKYTLHNEYMVCVGYANLLDELCERIGIPSHQIGVEFKDTKNNNQNYGHARNMVYIKDDKYGIDGLYIADATWDNEMEKDQYTHANMTHSLVSQEGINIKLSNLDLLTDCHSWEEYNVKMNYLLDKEYKKEESSLKNVGSLSNMGEGKFKVLHSNLVMENTYKNILNDICYRMYSINENLVTEIKEKMSSLPEDSSQIMNRIEVYKELLTAYGAFVINHTNKEIPQQITITAALASKLKTGMSEEDLKAWYIETKQHNEDDLENNFKYFKEDLSINSHQFDRVEHSKTR